ncbi:hypothetical protein [Poriferisphaera sp. WC338]|uniref:hypothetical protein n=1 Tax=Poriferisphaera sp. WC338 TaxID=3425129 RepID=UPI003D813F4C
MMGELGANKPEQKKHHHGNWLLVFYYFYVLVMIFFLVGVFIYALYIQTGAPDQDQLGAQPQWLGQFLAVIAAVGSILFVMPFFMKFDRFTYNYNFLLICLGCLLIFPLPLTIPLILLWLRPHNRMRFNLDPLPIYHRPAH